MLINQRDAFRGQYKSPNSITALQALHTHIRYCFLLCPNINFVFKTRLFYDIRLSKNVVTLNSGSQVTPGRNESNNIQKIVYGFLSVFLYNIAPKTFEIFDFKTAVTSKAGLLVRQGHRNCHHAIKRM